MSIRDDLARNRRAYQSLSAGIQEAEEDFTRARPPGIHPGSLPEAVTTGEEWGSLTPEEFRQSQLRMNSESGFPAASREGEAEGPAVYSLDTPALSRGRRAAWEESVTGGAAGRTSFQQSVSGDSERYHWGERPGGALSPSQNGVEVRTVEYPEPSGEGAADNGDLLDTLLHRIEAGARRYPQSLTEEGNSW